MLCRDRGRLRVWGTPVVVGAVSGRETACPISDYLLVPLGRLINISALRYFFVSIYFLVYH
jgi:hypothetical protein